MASKEFSTKCVGCKCIKKILETRVQTVKTHPKGSSLFLLFYCLWSLYSLILFISPPSHALTRYVSFTDMQTQSVIQKHSETHTHACTHTHSLSRSLSLTHKNTHSFVDTGGVIEAYAVTRRLSISSYLPETAAD